MVEILDLGRVPVVSGGVYVQELGDDPRNVHVRGTGVYIGGIGSEKVEFVQGAIAFVCAAETDSDEKA